MGCKSYALGTIAEINADQYSPKEGWVRIQYLDTGSVTRGHIETLQVLEPGIEKIPGRARRKVKDGSIVYSMVRPNQEHYALLNHPPTDMLASTGFAVIDAKQDIVLPRYLYYTLTRPNVIAHFQALAEQNASTYPTLAKDDLTQLELIIPSINEQRAISAVLASFDQKIAVNNRINDYLAVMAMSLFNSQCPQSSEPNAVLSDIAEITMGQSPSGSSYNEDGNGVVFYQGRAEFGSFFPRRRLYTTEPKRMAREGDTLMSIRAPVGDLNVANEGCCIGRGLAAIHSENNQSFVHYLVRAQGRQLDTFNGDGTVFGSINGKALKELPVFLPDNDVITQLESQLKPIDALIRRNDDETQALERMRDTLLPKLMSGEIDVSEIDLRS